MPAPEQPIAERKRALIAGLLFSVFMTLAFPPIGLWGFAFVSISPLVWCAWTTNKPWRAALFAGLGSAPFWAFEHRWLVDVTLAGYPLVVLYLSLYPALFVWITARLRRCGGFWARPVVWFVAAALVWSGLETLRGEVVFYGYPWFYVGHPTVTTPGWAYLASIIGASGVSALTALVASLLAWTLCLGRRRNILIPAGVFLLGSGVGFFAGLAGLTVVPTPSVVVAVIQTDVPQSNKIGWTIEQKMADFDRFVELSSIAASEDPRPDLLVWPETMFPGLALDPAAVAIERSANLRFPDGTPTTYFHDALLSLQRTITVPMLVGALGVDGLRIEIDPEGNVSIDQDALYNSVFLIVDGAVTEHRYDKVHLTPFGEVMPYISASDWLESRLLDFGAKGMSFALEAGNDPTSFDVSVSRHAPIDRPPPGEPSEFDRPDRLRIATPVCFEATMPGVVRRLAMNPDGSRKADIIIQVSNDGWFGVFSGPREQHLQLCHWRSIELNTPIVRSVNTGISAAIGMRWQGVRWQDEQRIDPRSDAWSEGVFSADLILQPKTTLYARVGYLFPWLTLAFTALVLIVPMVPRGARRDDSAADADESDAPEGPADAHADATDAPTAPITPAPAKPDPGGSA